MSNIKLIKKAAAEARARQAKEDNGGSKPVAKEKETKKKSGKGKKERASM